MVPCVGLASGLGAGIEACGNGPLFIQKNLLIEGFDLAWKDMLVPWQTVSDKYKVIAELNAQLATMTKHLAESGHFFLSFGGDHSSAIGTWSGVSVAKKSEGDIGLLWIDAHMDCHTPETTPSGNIHGMPLASLLGHGETLLTSILSENPKIKPENVALIGIRSFESGEAALLEKLKVKIFYAEDVQKRGLKDIVEEVLNDFETRTCGFGVSFDLDAIDPNHITAVGTPVENGLDPHDALECIELMANRKLIAFELVEYNPQLDTDLSTFRFIQQMITKIVSTQELAIARRLT